MRRKESHGRNERVKERKRGGGRGREIKSNKSDHVTVAVFNVQLMKPSLRERVRERDRETEYRWRCGQGVRTRERETPFTCRGELRSGQRDRLDPHYAEGAPSPATMYVSYLQLDKDPAMYPHQNAVTRHLTPGLSLSPQNFAVPAPPQYTDFAGYHHHGINNELHPAQQAGPGSGGWNPAYPPPPPPTRDEWSTHHYVAAAAAAAAGGPGGPQSTMAGAVGPTLGFSPPEFPGQPPALLNASAGQLSPGSPQRRNAYDWIRRSSAPPCNPSKTHS